MEPFATPQPDERRTELRRSLRSALIGNTLEYFDWTIYATFSPFIAKSLFSASDPTSGVLLTLAIFAVAFVARPIGGAVFGRIADQRGRKTALMWSMVLMGFGSLLLALIPSYAQIGVAASILLTFVRLLQGLAYGGETSASYIYVSELAPNSRRGLWSSSVFASVSVGAIAGTLSGFILTNVLEPDFLRTWGWRIPFIVGAILSVYALRLRMNSVETEVGETLTQKSEESAETVTIPMSAEQKRDAVLQLVRLFCILGATNVAFYTWLSFASTYAITSLGMNSRSAFAASLAAQTLTLAFFPLFGLLSDRFGRKPVALIATVGFAVITFPLAQVLNANPISLFTAQFIALVFWAAIGSIWPAILSENVTPRMRAVGLGITTSLASGVFGGTAPYLNTWLTSIDMQWVFSAYLVALMLMASVLLTTMRETKGIDLTTMKIQESTGDTPEEHHVFAGR
ncbi:MFS transporter [Rhodococcus sp. NPDC059968]|uniref:MFS transporter n=1 Tax=Rhodococcus sp. NPDC059968 TaxID=3347017 RepID=UPI00366FE663